MAFSAVRWCNVCSWAIINGELDYGVSGHFIDEDIDTGDIVAQRNFPVAEDETGLSLTMKCIRTGLETFKELVPAFASR